MIKILNKKNAFSFVLILIAVVYCSFALAGGFGIYSDYGTNNPLIVAPGGEASIKIELMNGEQINGTMLAKAELLNSEGIATLADSNLEYSLPYMVRVPVNIRVSIPATAAEGTRYKLNFRFADITPSAGGGTVSLGTSSTVFVDVLVQKPAETPEKISIGWIILGVIVIIAAIVLIYFIVKSRKQ